MMTDNAISQQRITELFDLLADGYDHAALRFFPFSADALVHFLRPSPGSKVLDVATGTGAAAVAAAQCIGPTGRVQAIDLSEDMIDRAIRNVDKMALHNVDYHVMDAAQPEFKSGYFDAVMCGFGIFFLADMPAALTQWLRVLKPGGQLAFSVFADSAFEPMATLFREQIARYGVDAEKMAWQRLTDGQQCRQLLEAAGADTIRVADRQMGYHLNHGNDWWDVIWNSGFRGYVEQLHPEQLQAFREQHLAEVAGLLTDKGLWMDVNVIFAGGRKPDQH